MTNQLALDLIRRFEGCHLTAYPDPGTGGRPFTIGWGNTRIGGHAVVPGQVITQAQADAALVDTVNQIEATLARTIPGWERLTVAQQAALLSFSFNCGERWFGASGFSTLTRTLREGRLRDVPGALLLYTNPGTRVTAGLRRRRIAEGLLWSSGAKP